MARASRTRFAVCIDNSGYPASLELHKIYRVLPDKEAEEDGDIRIVDEADRPVCVSRCTLAVRPKQ